MNHPAQRRNVATERKRRAKANAAPRRPKVTLAGIDDLPPSDLEPGAPDAVDLTETARPMSPQASKEIALAAGDVDASFHGLDGGEEAPGGSDPLPDQNDVDQIGAALGVVEQDGKPLATTEKIVGRDERRWELDPASSEDFDEREREVAAPRRRGRRP